VLGVSVLDVAVLGVSIMLGVSVLSVSEVGVTVINLSTQLECDSRKLQPSWPINQNLSSSLRVIRVIRLIRVIRVIRVIGLLEL
jgi:ABC-type Fe3+-siderophore transport system permease subunit